MSMMEDLFAQALKAAEGHHDVIAVLNAAQKLWEEGNRQAAFWILEAFHLGQMTALRAPASAAAEELSRTLQGRFFDLSRAAMRIMR